MNRSPSQRIRFAVLASAAYLVGSVLLYDAVGEAAMKLAVLPIIAMAVAFGRTGAVIAALVVIPTNYILVQQGSALGVQPHPEYRFWSAQVLLLVIGTFAGNFGNIRLRLEKEVSRRQRIEHELRDALDQVKGFRGTVPICSACKQIREETGEWVAVESFIQERSDATFTHGICPPCADALYPESRSRSQPERLRRVEPPRGFRRRSTCR